MAAPQRKAGLWQLSTETDGQAAAGAFAGPIKLCLDAATDRRQSVFGRRRGACDSYSVTRGAGGGYVIDSVCQTRSGAKVTSHSVVSGDFNAKYTATSDTTVEGSDNPDFNGKHHRTTTATYLGACPTGMSPGQIMTPDGQIVDMPTGRGMGGGGNAGGGGGGSGGGGGQ